ncbi:MAG: hypothetical protein BJ554DRAFT_929 [Olpidium bornovanus]|uniref:Uncharacterized protein n=1 Tax=Olpidium bornovanus TaxID=278681 RepID=A0A8H8A1E2_9FUNG|nr:MAG: hypothetical protein BJ554DRAFT_929 [Olpidium bornovanus]
MTSTSVFDENLGERRLRRLVQETLRRVNDGRFLERKREPNIGCRRPQPFRDRPRSARRGQPISPVTSDYQNQERAPALIRQ